ncbi:hypothetical protein [Halobacillus hunanensis]|uniref:hypothetical protein n=1 Tax=Halobacillus hunanensis TaxID=578214 RepID=UPI0009A89E2A|nr:hypothetical protein [Halobacillus hunanensis]
MKTKNQLLDLGLEPDDQNDGCTDLMVYSIDYTEANNMTPMTHRLYGIADIKPLQVNDNTLTIGNICKSLYDLSLMENVS